MDGPPANAQDLHAQGKHLLNAGDVAAAHSVLRRAASVAQTADELSLIDGTLAFVEAERGDIESAEHRCTNALNRSANSAAMSARLTGQLGYVKWLRGDTAGAVALYSAALDALDDDARVAVLVNRGTAYLAIGRLRAARTDFNEVVAATDPIAAAMCRHNLGFLDLLRGDLISALRRMDEARPDLIELGPASAATCDIDRSDALSASGLGREAVGLLRRTRDDLADSDLWRYLADVEIRLAQVLDGADATAVAESARRRYAEKGNDVEADSAQAVALHLRAQSEDPPAPEELDEVAERLAHAGRTEAAHALRIRAAGLRGEFPEAAGDGAPLTARLLAAEVGAEVALSKGDAREALRRTRAAIDELEEWQRSIGSLELQNSTITLGGQVIRLGQQAALATGDPTALLEWSERAREVASRGVPSRPPEELGDLLARLRHLGPDGDPAKRADLIERIRHGRWHATGSIEAAHTLTLDQLKTALGSARFISILDIDQQVIALVVETNEVNVQRLGPWVQLEEQIGGLPADLALTAQSTMPLVRRSLAERLTAIDTILAPAFAGASDVVLAVPDELAHVPWGQLDSLRATPVILPVSATAWVRASAHPPAPLRSVGVVVGPDTHTGKDEADAVAAAWADKAEVTVLTEATCNQVRDLATTVDVLHISAHGRDRDGHRLFAATELADGEWFGHDIELLPHVPDIVVLSACSVGGGSLGMTRAWLHAGARHVIASPADISETAAAERFPQLHALLADGLTPERAVAEAFGPDALDCTVQSYGPPPLSDPVAVGRS